MCVCRLDLPTAVCYEIFFCACPHQSSHGCESFKHSASPIQIISSAYVCFYLCSHRSESVVIDLPPSSSLLLYHIIILSIGRSIHLISVSYLRTSVPTHQHTYVSICLSVSVCLSNYLPSKLSLPPSLPLLLPLPSSLSSSNFLCPSLAPLPLFYVTICINFSIFIHRPA